MNRRTNTAAMAMWACTRSSGDWKRGAASNSMRPSTAQTGATASEGKSFQVASATKRLASAAAASPAQGTSLGGTAASRLRTK